MLNTANDLLNHFIFKTILTCVCGLFGFLFWDVNITVYALTSLMIIDFILWISIAIKRKEVSKSKMKSWMFKFILYWLLIIVWNQVDRIIKIDYICFKYLFISYLAITESLSILEHLAYYDLKIPLWIIGILKDYKQKFEDPNFLKK